MKKKPFNSIRKRLIILQPYVDCRTLEIRNHFLDNEWEVKIIGPEEKHYHPRCVLMLPDTGGINANISYFKHDAVLPPNVPPQDQAMEFFRLETLSWYLKKQYTPNRVFGVLGIGASAFLTFAEVLGGSIFFSDRKLQFGITKADAEIQDMYFHAYEERVAGLVSPSLDQQLHMANLLLKNGGGGDLVPALVPSRPLTLIEHL